MPTYDYRCVANGQVVEVNHRMSEVLSTWGELCEHSGTALGETPAQSRVDRLATGGHVVQRGTLNNPAAPACPAAGNGCGGCSLN